MKIQMLKLFHPILISLIKPLLIRKQIEAIDRIAQAKRREHLKQEKQDAII